MHCICAWYPAIWKTDKILCQLEYLQRIFLADLLISVLIFFISSGDNECCWISIRLGALVSHSCLTNLFGSVIVDCATQRKSDNHFHWSFTDCGRSELFSFSASLCSFAISGFFSDLKSFRTAVARLHLSLSLKLIRTSAWSYFLPYDSIAGPHLVAHDLTDTWPNRCCPTATY